SSSIQCRNYSTVPSQITLARGTSRPSRHSRSAGKESSVKNADSAARPMTWLRLKERAVRATSSMKPCRNGCLRCQASRTNHSLSQNPTTEETLAPVPVRAPVGPSRAAAPCRRCVHAPPYGDATPHVSFPSHLDKNAVRVPFSIHDRCLGPHAPRAPARGPSAGRQRHLLQRRLILPHL